ncbi:rRNA maturation RNase YbeY [Microaceticoccus formicicus]|uniref:rRNA maturation RNase YbeY n=1 Tax=Microaceticoccus formicicus TaxID=3118105 RepID=UPI003CD007BD|nr:rRNA maturation RNase YbeY [Peptoniphilaceae bacterium AMB_02]
MDIYIDSRVAEFSPDSELEDMINNAVQESLKEDNLSGDFEISISFVEEDEIKELNADYRGIDSVTDVLSFPLIEDPSIEDGLLGDIVICYKRAIEQSIEYGHSSKREIIYLVVHSMFHLLGYDHMVDEDKREMRSKEKSVLKRLGV